jgi:DNA-binding transcriptional LysR family regulator
MPKNSMVNLDIDVLRSFVTGLDLGSFARAAERLGRSTSAVSAQMKKLEEQVGAPVLRKSGRGLTLTPTGEIVLGYARRLLELNDAALHAVRGACLSGQIRVGVAEDFGEGFLTGILTHFAATHPGVEVYAHVARNAELERRILAGEVDIILGWRTGTVLPAQQGLFDAPLRWIGGPGHGIPLEHGFPLPLVLLEAPCLMRSHALAALDQAGIPWRVAFTSASLSGVWAAVRAGLGITVRSGFGCPADLGMLENLPALPSLGLCLATGAGKEDPVRDAMVSIMCEQLACMPDQL